MEVEEAVRQLRVIRRFSDRSLPDGILERLVDAARRTGSSKNEQRWAFVTVTDPGTLERLSHVGDYAGHLAGAAAAIAQVTPALASRSDLWDAGRAAQNMVLLALAEGIGSCPATVYRPDLAGEILRLPADQQCRGPRPRAAGHRTPPAGRGAPPRTLVRPLGIIARPPSRGSAEPRDRPYQTV
jgi:nitroreductase